MLIAPISYNFKSYVFLQSKCSPLSEDLRGKKHYTVI